MSYIKGNKNAWEQAFEMRQGDYAKDITTALKNEANPFLDANFYTVLKSHDFKDKTIAQFCTNNGRELLQLSRLNIKQSIGFELAANMVEYANSIAQAMQLPATFIQTDILEINDTYASMFDYGLITVGALCWFKDLNAFFKQIFKTLKPHATLFIHESHPFGLMLAAQSEESFNPKNPKQLVYDYFGNIEWQENSMGYMTDKKTSEAVFTSFSHTLSDIFEALINQGFNMRYFKEYDYCVANLFTHLDHQGIPLSMIISAEKND